MLKRPRIHNVVLFCALGATGFCTFKMVFDDYGPFAGWVNVHWVEIKDRRQVGYEYVPKLHESSFGRYYDLYSSESYVKGPVGYCTYDEPYWPDKSHAATGTDLPPLVRRHQIRALSAPFALTCIAWLWTLWGLLYAWYRAQSSRTHARGFPLQPR